MVQKQLLRLIAGKWRGKKLPFPAHTSIRPTPDRLRETLFNWLMFSIQGSACLDLFAGSGILSIESLSRGASRVVSVDQDERCTQHLLKTRETWHIPAEEWQIVKSDALDYLVLESPPFKTFDIIFLDPPYDSEEYRPCLEAILEQRLLSEAGWVYLETRPGKVSEILKNVPYSVLKSTRVGQAEGHLLQAILPK